MKKINLNDGRAGKNMRVFHKSFIGVISFLILLEGMWAIPVSAQQQVEAIPMPTELFFQDSEDRPICHFITVSLPKGESLFHSKVGQYIQEGNKWLLETEGEKAQEMYAAALELAPNHALLTMLLSASQFYRNKRTEALETLKKAYQLAPKDSEEQRCIKRNLDELVANMEWNKKLLMTPITTDTRTHVIRNRFGTFELFYSKFIQNTSGLFVHLYITADSVADAKAIRAKYVPPSSAIPRLTYYEVWTKKDDAVGRDYLEDYEDIISQ